MRPHRLEITAFGPFADTAIVDFDDLAAAGLVLLHGDTGAGKTSVLDALGYALYGEVPGVRGIKRLRSDHADARRGDAGSVGVHRRWSSDAHQPQSAPRGRQAARDGTAGPAAAGPARAAFRRAVAAPGRSAGRSSSDRRRRRRAVRRPSSFKWCCSRRVASPISCMRLPASGSSCSNGSFGTRRFADVERVLGDRRHAFADQVRTPRPRCGCSSMRSRRLRRTISMRRPLRGIRLPTRPRSSGHAICYGPGNSSCRWTRNATWPRRSGTRRGNARPRRERKAR